MKKTIRIGSIVLLCSFFLLTFVGCEAYDHAACLKSVEKEFPNSQIRMVGAKRYRFIIKTEDGTIWYAETGNYMNANISLKQQLF